MDITVHEVGHYLHLLGFSQIWPQFQEGQDACYKNAVSAPSWLCSPPSSAALNQPSVQFDLTYVYYVVQYYSRFQSFTLPCTYMLLSILPIRPIFNMLMLSTRPFVHAALDILPQEWFSALNSMPSPTWMR